MTPKEPVFVETPLASVADTQVEKVIIDRFTLMVERPVDAYSLLDDPVVREAHERDEYMPYWADIWPSSRMLAKTLAKEDWSGFPQTNGKVEVLELGCGLGIPGLTALACGLRTTFSDYDLTALDFAARNARRNKLYDFRVQPIDWRFPPPQQYPVIIGADLTYEERSIVPLVQLLQAMLLPGGVCWLTDQDRTPAPLLREQLGLRGLKYESHVVRAGEPGGFRIQGTLYKIRRA